jgi:hypothetical protein
MLLGVSVGLLCVLTAGKTMVGGFFRKSASGYPSLDIRCKEQPFESTVANQ